ncbi:HEXXH motif-containing putative peptide modification protein [Streptomyces roseifaciens]
MRFLNVHHAHENIARLTGALSGEYPSMNTIDRAYRRVISHMREFAAPTMSIRISFKDDAWGEFLVANQVFENVLEGLEDTPEHKRQLWKHQFQEALSYTREQFPDLGRLVDLVLTDVVLFSSKNKGGGSGSHVPGLASISPGDDWQVHDFAESTVHEVVHLNVFLADMVHRLYKEPADVLAEQNNRVVSAVKFGQMRPLDKAFHSAVVAPPLMLMQARRGETELLDKFRASLRECTDGLLDKYELFTPYGQVLVDELRVFTDSYDLDLVEESISGTKFAHYELAAG